MGAFLLIMGYLNKAILRGVVVACKALNSVVGFRSLHGSHYSAKCGSKNVPIDVGSDLAASVYILVWFGKGAPPPIGETYLSEVKEPT